MTNNSKSQEISDTEITQSACRRCCSHFITSISHDVKTVTNI